ncbi:cytochrome bd-I ubiquinol oxidase subunit 2 apoprotein [Leucobacter luti]|uniref:Cytochrome bd-I ubiquinol oxidase subunit 2 apoprotein n=1 Tax=Leucobacter luti TaxID=340320 RepID=A0A4R6RTL6_9MICO|nr:cytochrome d ubiquinol oxidase subunit II [Leucobacter luti]MCW2287973.1 cytochrome d ubiquinol oxidase subunit II [Leucobacter luti]TCK45865.1 cytochrome bd-I ubiquinol oxidase subunit 2 apoprotein [Leucobacter luti]TDP90241.1 cytochrome bd-I ubiquinol oxidase subunit 2 apoprotein [Leucobacter luti]
MELTTLWFFIVGVLLIGYFVLDGFDFGVGMSLPFLGKDDTDRRLLVNTIGPVWDLNETWLIVAGACLFAAFPEWYATMFSGFYLALLLILVALIFRGVSFEYRHQGKGQRWTRWFDHFIFWGSVLPPLLWGVAFANLAQGLPISRMDNGGWIYEGTLLTLLNPYGLLGGLTLLLITFTHGLVFVALKTLGDMRERARALATKVGVVTIIVGAAFLIWTIMQHLESDTLWAIILCSALAAVALIGGWLANLRGREGWAFTANAAAIVFALLAVFMALFPNLMHSSIDPAESMSIVGAASSQKTLELMTWVAACTLPLVLAYQAWTYWIFRKRLSRESIPAGAH